MFAILLTVAALDGAAFVVFGAAGSHGAISDPVLQRLFDTANAYHAWHALALLGIAVGVGQLAGIARRFALFSAAAFAFGTVLFCGPLYFRAFEMGAGLGPLTPIGGGLLILGWLALAVAGGLAWMNRSG